MIPVSVAREGTCLGAGFSGKGDSGTALEETSPEPAERDAAGEGGGEAGNMGTVSIVSVPADRGAEGGAERGPENGTPAGTCTGTGVTLFSMTASDDTVDSGAAPASDT